MSKYFEHHGRVFMIVTPQSWLMNSKTISSIYQRGALLVVDIETGELMMYKTAEKTKPAVSHRVYYQPYGLKSIRLSDDLELAELQLKDQFAVGNCSGKIWYTDSEGNRTHARVWNLDYALSILERIYNE